MSTAPAADLSSVRAEKAALRAALRQHRAAAPATVDESAAVARAAGLPGLRAAPVVAVYHALAGELDPAPLGAALRDGGAALCYPRVVSLRPPRLSFHRVDDPAALVPGPFQLREPAPDAPEVAPAAFVVPGLAFDRAGFRLGFGAGLYDAALSACPAALRVGLCPDAALREALPHEEHDEPMDLIVTPSEILVTAARPLGGAS